MNSKIRTKIFTSPVHNTDLRNLMGASDEFYFGETGNDTSIYADRWAQTASGDMIINNDKKLTVCIKDDVDISGSGKI